MYKEMYNHCDSYPDGLGLNVVRAIRGVSVDDLRTTAREVTLVPSEGRPTAAEIATYERYGDRQASRRLESWYWLLRNVQNHVEAYTRDGLRVMTANGGHDDRMCDYGYIVDVDAERLLVYKFGSLAAIIDLDVLNDLDDDAALDVMNGDDDDEEED